MGEIDDQDTGEEAHELDEESEESARVNPHQLGG